MSAFAGLSRPPKRSKASQASAQPASARPRIDVGAAGRFIRAAVASSFHSDKVPPPRADTTDHNDANDEEYNDVEFTDAGQEDEFEEEWADAGEEEWGDADAFDAAEEEFADHNDEEFGQEEDQGDATDVAPAKPSIFSRLGNGPPPTTANSGTPAPGRVRLKVNAAAAGRFIRAASRRTEADNAAQLAKHLGIEATSQAAPDEPGHEFDEEFGDHGEEEFGEFDEEFGEEQEEEFYNAVEAEHPADAEAKDPPPSIFTQIPTASTPSTITSLSVNGGASSTAPPSVTVKVILGALPTASAPSPAAVQSPPPSIKATTPAEDKGTRRHSSYGDFCTPEPFWITAKERRKSDHEETAKAKTREKIQSLRGKPAGPAQQIAKASVHKPTGSPTVVKPTFPIALTFHFAIPFVGGASLPELRQAVAAAAITAPPTNHKRHRSTSLLLDKWTAEPPNPKRRKLKEAPPTSTAAPKALPPNAKGKPKPGAKKPAVKPSDKLAPPVAPAPKAPKPAKASAAAQPAKPKASAAKVPAKPSVVRKK